jgi:hypothetical protein
VVISGVIDEELEDSYLDRVQFETTAEIIAADENGAECVLFRGNIAEIHIDTLNNVRVLTLNLISFTEDMDQAEHTRSFQRENITYKQILDSLNYYKEYAYYISENEQKQIQDMIVQYKETDWNFIKRLASHFNSFVYPRDNGEGVNYYFGRPNRGQKGTVKPVAYAMKKDVSEYQEKSVHQVGGITESDAIYYVIKSREVYEICDPIEFKSQNLYVYAVRSVLEGQELLNYYTLKSANGFKMCRADNERAAGSSLDGKVTKVQKDQVQISLHTDDRNSIPDNIRWIPFSTVYSTPDGTGWYAMPEIGDEIRLYFPSEKENAGYVISAVHLESSNYAARSKPEEKSLRNIHGKEILLTPDKIVMTNNRGMSITLDDAKGIIIESDKSVYLSSDEEIRMVSSNSSISVTGAQKVEILQDHSSIELKNDVFFKGTQVHIQ